MKGEIVTIIDNAGRIVYRHVNMDELRETIAKKCDAGAEWAEVIDYIENECGLNSDNYLNCIIVIDDEFDPSGYAGYTQRMFELPADVSIGTTKKKGH